MGNPQGSLRDPSETTRTPSLRDDDIVQTTTQKRIGKSDSSRRIRYRKVWGFESPFGHSGSIMHCPKQISDFLLENCRVPLLLARRAKEISKIIQYLEERGDKVIVTCYPWTGVCIFLEKEAHILVFVEKYKNNPTEFSYKGWVEGLGDKEVPPLSTQDLVSILLHT